MTYKHGEVDHDEPPDRPHDWVAIVIFAVIIGGCIIGALISIPAP
jgi:hypothetical protein